VHEVRKPNAGVKLEAQSEKMQEAAKRAAEKAAAAKKGKPQQQQAEEEEEEEEDDEDEESSAASSGTGRGKAAALVGGYNAAEYDKLDVSSEVRELFQYIARYKPHELELDTKLKCFIPDFIPAVGQIDTFVKIPHPAMEPDYLGLRVLDEPAANQSDPTVLELQLRALSKKSVRGPIMVRSIENASRDKKAVQSWIDSIKELHRAKPMPTVHYTRQMPDIDSLMQVWPEELEQLMRDLSLPKADIDLDLKDYCRVVCALLDIPVFNNMIEPLHVLFTLYMEFKSNQHFQRNNNQLESQVPQENYFSNE
jgi:intraflagellar transport protein 46